MAAVSAWGPIPVLAAAGQSATPVALGTPAPAPAAAAPQSQQPGSSPVQPSITNPQTLHVTVGHSILLRTPSRIKRVLTGNPTVLESILTSPSEVILTAKQPGGSSLIIWEENGQSRMLDVFADLDVTPLRNALDESFPNSGVEVQAQEDKITLVGAVPSQAVAEQMLKMAGNFSKEVVNGLLVAPPRQRQVMLKVRFAEADRAKLSQFGFNLFSTGATNTIGSITTQQFTPPSVSQANGTSSAFSLASLLNIFLFRKDINLGATIQFLQEKNALQILAEPDLMAISGQPAHFLAGGEFPYPVVQFSSGGTGFGSVTIVFKPYGVKLEFTGTIFDDTIRLKVAPEVSSLDYTNAVVISGFTLPALQTRRAETEIELKDGQSFGIAGLLDQNTTVQLSKIPGIGDIPILGQLFRSHNINRTNTELLVLVTANIVDPVSGVLPPQQELKMPMKPLDNGSYDQNLPNSTAPNPAKPGGGSK